MLGGTVLDSVTAPVAADHVERAVARAAQRPAVEALRLARLAPELAAVALLAGIQRCIAAVVAARRIERAICSASERASHEPLGRAALSAEVRRVALFTHVDGAVAAGADRALAPVERAARVAPKLTAEAPLGDAVLAAQGEAVALLAHADGPVSAAGRRVERAIRLADEPVSRVAERGTGLAVQVGLVALLARVELAVATGRRGVGLEDIRPERIGLEGIRLERIGCAVASRQRRIWDGRIRDRDIRVPERRPVQASYVSRDSSWLIRIDSFRFIHAAVRRNCIARSGPTTAASTSEQAGEGDDSGTHSKRAS